MANEITTNRLREIISGCALDIPREEIAAIASALHDRLVFAGASGTSKLVRQFAWDIEGFQLPATAAEELNTIRAMAMMLEGLEPSSRGRVLAFVEDAFNFRSAP